MLSNIHLLLKLPTLIKAVKNTVSDFHSEICWVGDQYFTIQITALYKGHKYSAWGIDKNETLAFAKAVMELIERLHLNLTPLKWKNFETNQVVTHQEIQRLFPIVDKFCETSSGVAAHLSKSSAINGSVAEIIERHVLTKATLESISPKENSSDTYIWKGPLKHHVCLMAHKLPSKGMIFSSSAHKNLSQLIKASIKEISSMKEWCKNSYNVESLLSNYEKGRPSEIQAYFLTENPNLSFLERQNESIVSPNIEKKDIWTSEVTLLPNFKNIRSLYVTRAFSPLMQPLQFGKLLDSTINPMAIDVSNINTTVDYNVVA
jgi:hypothetical protein